MSNKYSNLPVEEMFTITPTDDDTPVAGNPTAMRVDAAGTLKFRPYNSAADVTLNVLQGEVILVRPLYVRDTGTTATVHGLK